MEGGHVHVPVGFLEEWFRELFYPAGVGPLEGLPQLGDALELVEVDAFVVLPEEVADLAGDIVLELAVLFGHGVDTLALPDLLGDVLGGVELDAHVLQVLLFFQEVVDALLFGGLFAGGGRLPLFELFVDQGLFLVLGVVLQFVEVAQNIGVLHEVAVLEYDRPVLHDVGHVSLLHLARFGSGVAFQVYLLGLQEHVLLVLGLGEDEVLVLQYLAEGQAGVVEYFGLFYQTVFLFPVGGHLFAQSEQF